MHANGDLGRISLNNIDKQKGRIESNRIYLMMEICSTPKGLSVELLGYIGFA